MGRMGERISSLRAAKGMTRKQLAKSIGVNEKYIEEVETGRRVINSELLTKVSKILEQDVGETEVFETADDSRTTDEAKKIKKPVEIKEIQKVWHDAFDSVLKTIPIYEYDLNSVLGTRQLPVVSNKIEGHSKDKVCYLEIKDNDMIGFRIASGDVAFGYFTQEVENNSICLIDYEGQRVIRQIKKLDGDKVLLVNNNGRLMTETAAVKDIKVVARLTRLEVKL